MNSPMPKELRPLNEFSHLEENDMPKKRRDSRRNKKEKRNSIPKKSNETAKFKKHVRFRDDIEGNSLCIVYEIESYKKYYNISSDAHCSCTCSIF